MAAIKRKNRKIKKQAMAAAYTLLGVAPAAYAADADGWTVDTSFLHYSETNRISIIGTDGGREAIFHRWTIPQFIGHSRCDLGSTPVGTLPVKPSGIPVTITTPSGHRHQYARVVIPVSQYHDTRYGIDGSWQQPLGLGFTGTMGGQYSKQSDFVSAGGNLSLAKDLNRRDTTLSLGFSPAVRHKLPARRGSGPFFVHTDSSVFQR